MAFVEVEVSFSLFLWTVGIPQKGSPPYCILTAPLGLISPERLQTVHTGLLVHSLEAFSSIEP